MSLGAIKEYMKLIPEGIKNIDKVVQGLVNDVRLNHGNLPEEEQVEILKRRMICATCPFLSKNAGKSEEYLKLTGEHYHTQRGSAHCSFCGCPISIRTASLSKECGIETWNADNPENTMELKWTKFKKQ